MTTVLLNVVVVEREGAVDKASVEVSKRVITFLSTEDILSWVDRGIRVDLPDVVLVSCVNKLVVDKIPEAEPVGCEVEIETISNLVPGAVGDDVHVGHCVVLSWDKVALLVDGTFRDVWSGVRNVEPIVIFRRLAQIIPIFHT